MVDPQTNGYISYQCGIMDEYQIIAISDITWIYHIISSHISYTYMYIWIYSSYSLYI